MFTCAAIQKLYDEGLLKPTDKVFPKLGISSPAIAGDKPDHRINDIEVQHLVDHLGGWYRDVPNLGEPILAIRSIALRLKLPKQLTKMDFARYMYGQPLQFTQENSQQALILFKLWLCLARNVSGEGVASREGGG